MAAQYDVTSLLGSRICHDLISPLGAIGNGVELLSMSGAASTPEVALISESVDNANARIRFFRVAFGAAMTDATMSRGETVDILNDLTRSGRIAIDWDAGGTLRRGEVKLVFLMILCLESAMPWGGRIHVAGDDGNWTVTAASDRFKIDDALWSMLDGKSLNQALTAADVQFALVAGTAAMIGRTVEVTRTESEIRITF